MLIFQIIVKIRIHHQTTIRTLKFINWFIAESSCLRASEVLRTPDFALNFGCFQVADQIEAAFWKTNYNTFSYLLIPNYGQDMRESDFLTVPAKLQFCSSFTDINALDYYMKPKRFLLTTSCPNWIPISFLITTRTYIFSSFCAPS